MEIAFWGLVEQIFSTLGVFVMLIAVFVTRGKATPYVHSNFSRYLTYCFVFLLVSALAIRSFMFLIRQ